MSSVATFDTADALAVTPEAARHLKRQLAREPGSAGVRVAVKDSGCSGFMYVLEPIASAPAGHRRVVVDEELNLFVDEASLPVIAGTTLRFVREGLNEQIQFDNPRARDYCGCGESFTIDTAAH